MCQRYIYDFPIKTGTASTITTQESAYQFPLDLKNESIDVQTNSNDWAPNGVFEDRSYGQGNGTRMFLSRKCPVPLAGWGIKSTRCTMMFVLIFGLSFNAPRWFEYELINHKKPIDMYAYLPNYTSYGNISGLEIAGNDYNYITYDDVENDDRNSSIILFHNSHQNGSTMTAQPTSLKKNHLYQRYYHMIGSCIVMVIIPAAILMKTYCSFRKAMPSGSHRNRTHKIMLIIITMFIICHCPKVRTTKEIKIDYNI